MGRTHLVGEGLCFLAPRLTHLLSSNAGNQRLQSCIVFCSSQGLALGLNFRSLDFKAGLPKPLSLPKASRTLSALSEKLLIYCPIDWAKVTFITVMISLEILASNVWYLQVLEFVKIVLFNTNSATSALCL